VFEDAEAGITASLEAGMRVVGIGPAERVGAAHVVVPDLEGVTWNDLKTRLEQVDLPTAFTTGHHFGQ
jgi:kojibiose phosphorylase